MKTADIKALNLDGFVLSKEDLADLLPDVTPLEFEGIANLTGDYLMNYWQECLEQAVDVIKGDRITAKLKA
jgi:hypothetical protein